MRTTSINTGNLRELCWKAGLAGVTGLARKIGKSRAAIYAAIRRPSHYTPTIRAMERTLNLKVSHE